jgi:hypothetical protein
MSQTIKWTKKQWSTSKRKKLAQCPADFYASYVAKKYPYSPGPAQEIGNYCDKVLEDALVAGHTEIKRKQVAVDLVKIDPNYEYVEPLMDGMEGSLEYILGTTGLKFPQIRLAVNIKAQPVMVDWRKGSPLFDSAALDVLIITETTHAMVLDYKTGNPGFPDWFQLEDYAIHVFARFPSIQTVDTGIIWLRKGVDGKGQPFIQRPDSLVQRSDARGIFTRWASAHREAIELEASGEWPAKTHRMCSYCDEYKSQQCKAHNYT